MKRRRHRFRIWGFLLILAVWGAVLLLLEIQMRPLLESAAEHQLNQTVMSEINQAVGGTLSRENMTYETLISFEKDTNGQITAMKTNVRNENLLKTEIMDQILARLSTWEESTLEIPLGTLTGWGVLSGRGPTVRLQIQPLATSKTELRHHFSAAGINQTRHQIILEVTVDVRILLPGSTMETEIQDQIPIAETVIIGNIPGDYTYFQTNGDLSSVEKSGILVTD